MTSGTTSLHGKPVDRTGLVVRGPGIQKAGDVKEPEPPAVKEPAPPPRWPVILGSIATAVSALVALLVYLGNRGPGPATPQPANPSRSASASAPDSPAQPVAPTDTGPVAERRHGTLVLAAADFADLDSLAPDWARRSTPAADVDVWFDSREVVLAGAVHGEIGIVPTGTTGGFSVCAAKRDYGVTLPASQMTAGREVCALTGDDRVALLHITGVRHDSSGAPDQLTLDTTVWVPKHQV